MGSYRGAETAASFGDAAAEFKALLQGAAVFDMSLAVQAGLQRPRPCALDEWHGHQQHP